MYGLVITEVREDIERLRNKSLSPSLLGTWLYTDLHPESVNRLLSRQRPFRYELLLPSEQASNAIPHEICCWCAYASGMKWWRHLILERLTDKTLGIHLIACLAALHSSYLSTSLEHQTLQGIDLMDMSTIWYFLFTERFLQSGSFHCHSTVQGPRKAQLLWIYLFLLFPHSRLQPLISRLRNHSDTGAKNFCFGFSCTCGCRRAMAHLWNVLPHNRRLLRDHRWESPNLSNVARVPHASLPFFSNLHCLLRPRDLTKLTT